MSVEYSIEKKLDDNIQTNSSNILSWSRARLILPMVKELQWTLGDRHIHMFRLHPPRWPLASKVTGFSPLAHIEVWSVLSLYQSKWLYWPRSARSLLRRRCQNRLLGMQVCMENNVNH